MNKWKKSLKKNRIYFILILLLFVFTRCWIFTFEDTSIAPEILPLFEEGDTIIFKCNSKIDSFYVEKAIFYAVGEGETDLNYERFISKIIQIDCIETCYEFRSTIRPWEYYCGVDNKSFELVDYDKRFADLTRQIGSNQLEELYGSYNLEPDSVTGKEINYILYSKKYGVVEYKLNNGELYQLTEESLKMLMARE